MDEELAGSIRVYAEQRGFHAESTERWLAMSNEDAAALWDLTRDLRLGENQLRDLWEWAEEIAARDRTTLAAVLASDSLLVARRIAGGRKDRLKAIKASLRRLRFPILARTQHRIGALIASLELPAGVRLSVPDFLEGDEVRAEIVARDPRSLAAAARRLEVAAATSACEEIFELLSEAPESSDSDRDRK